jgi:thiol:disulfide interchange protein DsbD
MNASRRLLAPVSGLAVLAALSVLVAPSIASANFFDDVNEGFTGALDSGNYLVALPLIYLVGLLTALTPCVYPMIVITVSVFGARQAKSKAEAALLSTSFVMGIVSVFTPIGVIAALTGAAFGSWNGNPWIMFPIAIVLAVLSTSMFGAFELNLPPSLQNYFATVGGIGYRGAFGLGMVSAFIAAPCTGPALLGLLSYIAQSHAVGFGAAAMACYALGLGTLFFVVGTFSASLPKSGAWMTHVKSVFGVLLIVMALYFVKEWIPGFRMLHHVPEVLGAALVLIVAGVAIGAVHLDYHDPSVAIRVRKTTGIVLACAGGFGFAAWLVAAPPGLHWREDAHTAIAEARAAHTPYIVDFGASWCGACGELERNTFSDPRVQAEGGRFVAVHVDLSPGRDLTEGRALLASYDQRGLPLVVMHDSQGNEVHRVVEFVEPDELLELMQDVD